MRLSLIILTLASAMASIGHARADQTYQLYVACNKQAAATLALEPYPAYMLSPMIPDMCKAEEAALLARAQEEDAQTVLRTIMGDYNQKVIEYFRLERRREIQIAD